MVIDWTINVGNILVLISFLASVILVVFNAGGLKQTVADIKIDLDRLEKSQERIADALTQIAVQHVQLENLRAQVNALDRRVEDLRHGEGLIK